MPPRRSSSTAGRSPGRSPTASTTTTRSSSSSMPGRRAARRAPAEPGGRESMELSEDLKYRLAYLMLRLALDQKLSRADAGAHPGLLPFLDVLAGTHPAAEARGRRHASQREQVERFLDADFAGNELPRVARADAEI